MTILLNATSGVRFLLFIVVLGGGNCGIYKSSYNVPNISCLNSTPLPLSFIPPSPHYRNGFNRYHFCIYIHVYTFFVLYSPSYLLSCHLPSPTGINPTPTSGRTSGVRFWAMYHGYSCVQSRLGCLEHADRYQSSAQIGD
jgi:hypothetical protein